MKREEPHVLILMGPFVDERHKIIESGDVKIHDYCLQYTDLFKSLLTAIDTALSDTQTKILIQPSVRDVHHPYPFPQPAFDIDSDKIRCISNPQRIVINGAVIQVVNADVFSDMETCMACKPKGISQELVTKALLEQGSLYPIFPSASADFPIDYKLAEYFELNDQPDILLVQSTQPCFAFNYKGETLVINPGTLSRESSLGTYCMMTIHKEGSAENFTNRVRADIVKL